MNSRKKQETNIVLFSDDVNIIRDGYYIYSVLV